MLTPLTCPRWRQLRKEVHQLLAETHELYQLRKPLVQAAAIVGPVLIGSIHEKSVNAAIHMTNLGFPSVKPAKTGSSEIITNTLSSRGNANGPWQVYDEDSLDKVLIHMSQSPRLRLSQRLGCLLSLWVKNLGLTASESLPVKTRWLVPEIENAKSREAEWLNATAQNQSVPTRMEKGETQREFPLRQLLIETLEVLIGNSEFAEHIAIRATTRRIHMIGPTLISAEL